MKPVSSILLALAAATLAIMTTQGARAAELKNYEAAGFKAAQTSGVPIVIDIAASWCPTCAAQKPIVQSLVADPAYNQMVVFHVDFDSQKDIVRSFGAQMQSTLIAYKGEKETGRSVGDTNQDSIKALFASTLVN